MNFKERVIFLASIGFGIGVISTVLITAFIATLGQGDGNLYLCSIAFTEAVGNTLLAFAIQTILGGIFGAAVMGVSAVYGIEEWSIVKCTTVHYLFTMIGYFTLGFSVRWFDPGKLFDVFFMFFFMTAMYVVIWLANYLSYKKELNLINMELEELRAAEWKTEV